MLRNISIQGLKISQWVDYHSFIGLYHTHNDDWACYGWNKPGTKYFMIYLIDEGTIQKFGRILADSVDALALDRPQLV